MPLLRFLDVEISSGPCEFNEAPLLRTACLDGVATSSGTLPWLQLTCLTLRNACADDCTLVLQKTTNLVHCRLRLDLSGTTGRDQSDIVLPFLEFLTFDRHDRLPVTRYLTTFIVPALCSLEIPELSLGPNPIGSLQSFISKSGCRLQEVHITGKRTVSEDSYRVAFPSVQKLSFAKRL
jgi:hypothetical protein